MHSNSLSKEKSPYLQQHAHNPVDWFPWGDEAFEKAARENKPIFLSIGYSTCHWCHVMERESFESEEIADVLNRSFISIKVDREERPDVDRIYMTFVQATTGSGGWPMSVWLTPDRKPFFGGTYFPPDNRYNRPGFRSILEQIARAWSEDRDRIVDSSDQIVSQLTQHVAISASGGLPDSNVADHAFHTFRRMFDPRLGGFGGAPKFPRPAIHNFLVRYYAHAHTEEALDMVVLTLHEMAKGGMHDHLGGGFHRYSVDDRWFVPHFEKMLYDQAQLAISYLETYQITRDEKLAAVARDILDYVLRDMTDQQGGFYSAEDADSVIDPSKPQEKGEGAFYILSFAEISVSLEARVRDWFCYAYGVEHDGNVTADPHGEFTGRNILFQSRTPEETAAKFGAPPEEVYSALEAARAKLLRERAKRVRPHLDDKILTGWNALMISAFAKGAQILGEARYRNAAVRATEFVLKYLYIPEGGVLLRRYREGEAAVEGFLDDYAFFVQALLDVYETAFHPYYLELALHLAGLMLKRFEDTQGGGFFSSAEGGTDLIVRMKDDYDGAEPSGNSVAADVLLRLAHTTDRADFAAAAQSVFRAFNSRLDTASAGLPQLLAALLRSVAPAQQVVVVGDRNTPDTHAMLRTVRGRFLPNASVLLIDGDETRDTLARYTAALSGMQRLNGRAAAYVCENYTCQLPTTEVEKLAELLQ